MNLSRRPTVVYDLPLPDATTIIRPESVIVRFPHGLTVDLGALCYLRRQPMPKCKGRTRKKGEGRLVSRFINAERSERVRALIIHISDDLKNIVAAHGAGALVVSVTQEALAFGWLEAPGKVGADLACGEAMSFGNRLNFGGPYLGFMTVKDAFKREIPGRLVGQTRDLDGQVGYVLTLTAREQHIRRDKATSNICSNQGLVALGPTSSCSWPAPEGIRGLAERNAAKAQYLRGAPAGTAGLHPQVPGPVLQRVRHPLPGRRQGSPGGVRQGRHPARPGPDPLRRRPQELHPVVRHRTERPRADGGAGGSPGPGSEPGWIRNSGHDHAHPRTPHLRTFGARQDRHGPAPPGRASGPGHPPRPPEAVCLRGPAFGERSGRDPPLHPALPRQLRRGRRPLPPGLLHHEAQPQAQ